MFYSDFTVIAYYQVYTCNYINVIYVSKVQTSSKLHVFTVLVLILNTPKIDFIVKRSTIQDMEKPGSISSNVPVLNLKHY